MKILIFTLALLIMQVIQDEIPNKILVLSMCIAFYNFILLLFGKKQLSLEMLRILVGKTLKNSDKRESLDVEDDDSFNEDEINNPLEK